MLPLKSALGSLLRQRSFFAGAVATLALGIAAPTALFAVVQATLLRPLPYANAGDIYTVRTAMTDGRFTVGLVASEELGALRRTTDLVTASALVWRGDDSLVSEDGGEARQVLAMAVSEGFFDLFGVPMAVGRSFNASDFQRKTVRDVVLSGRMWRNHFGSDPAIVGRTIRLSASGPCLVVGVAPDAFDAPPGADFWIADHWQENIGHMFDAYVRLKPGTDPATLHAALGSMWEALGNKYPDMAKNRVFVFKPLLSSIVGDLGPTALIAFGATALLLLLAIANAANLLLARAATQARELAVRVALGASRFHLIRHLLAESVTIALPAAALGIPLAYGLVRAIVAIGGTALPRAEGLRFDPGVAIFAAAVMVLAALAVGLLPALTTADVRLTSVVNEGGRGGSAGPRTRALLGTLVVCEITLAIVLVAGSFRLLLSARNLLLVDPGFASEGRLIVDALVPRSYLSDPARLLAWSDEVTRRLRDLGATSVGLATSLPLRRETDSTTFTDIVGRPAEPALRPNGRMRIVDPGLFDALGIRVTRGRGFTLDDRPLNGPVVMVNEAWVSQFLPAGVDPLREQLSGLAARRVGEKFEPRTAPIIGVVANVRYSSLDKSPEPVVYLLDGERTPLRRSYVVTVPGGNPQRLIPGIRQALKELDPQVPVGFDTMSDVVSSSLVWSRLGMLLMGTFGAIALLLMGTGIFGVLAFVGAERHGEMAVRLCLGATPGGVLSLMLSQAARFVLLGAALGLAVAGWMGRLMSAYVYQVSAANAVVLLSSVLVVAFVSLAAAVLPARRAASVEPSRALRP